MLEFNIRNQEISRIDSFSPAEKSVEYLIAKFNFKTQDWNGATKRAIFRNIKSKEEKDTMLEDDSCTVPWEVLVGSSEIEVSVHGVIDAEKITTNVAVFNLNRTLSGGSATQEPSPTVYEQMVGIVKNAEYIAQSVRTDADNGKFNGKDGKDGKDGVDGEKGDKGEDGKSAYEYAVEGGYQGTEAEFMESLARAGDVITKSEHEAELLKAMVKVTTEESSFHHITDSANMKVVDFGMRGITEQETVPGNQLFDISKYVSDSQAINNGDGSITLTRYQFDGSTNRISKVLPTVVAGQTIIISATTSSKLIYFGNTVKAFNSAFEVTQEMLDGDYFGFYGINGETTSDNPLTISDIMVNEGTTVLPFEEYVGGMPSPNPEHEEEIELAGVYNEETGRYEHKCCVGNKNLFYKSNEYRATCDIPLPAGTTIACSAEVDYVGSTEIKYTDDTSYALGMALTTGERKHAAAYTVTKDVKQILFGLTAVEPQVEIGGLTDYEPYSGYTIVLTSDRPLTKWDNLVKVDGKWYWDYKQLHLTVDGNENWKLYEGKLGFSVEVLPEKISDRDGLCNQLRLTKLTGYTGTNTMRIGYNNRYFQVLYSDFYDDALEDSGLANFKAHLNEHPLEIYTYKDESELVPLLDEEQTLLNNLEMYYGVTNVYNEQGCPLWLTYAADQELHWNQKLLEIQQAII